MKNYIKHIVLLIGVFILCTSYYSSIHSEPLYYEVEFNDGVIHKWSREIFYNYENCLTLVEERLEKKYDSLEIEEINFNAAIQAYEEWEDSLKYVASEKVEQRVKQMLDEFEKSND